MAKRRTAHQLQRSIFVGMHIIAYAIASEMTDEEITDPQSEYIIDAFRQPVMLAAAFADLLTLARLDIPPTILQALDDERIGPTDPLITVESL